MQPQGRDAKPERDAASAGTATPSTPVHLAIPFSSNEVRLSLRNWAVAAVLTAVLLGAGRLAWDRLEKLPADPDYRIPYSLGQDYWLFKRYAARVDLGARIAFVGDSVIWGHYVSRTQTLTACLNELDRSGRFANLAVDGAHPVALAGLLEHYGPAIRDTKVVVLFNPLWITSRKQDLRDKKEFSFNHPDLAPQFSPRIPCYVKSTEKRVSIVLRRYIPLLGWADHVRQAYFENKDLGAWSADHPYRNPVRAVTFQLPPADEEPVPRPDPSPWTGKGLSLSPSWVPPAESFQWAYFVKALDTLQSRGNRVFVVINPMNEHMMTDAGRETYPALRASIQAALSARGIPFHATPLLPSELYADSSHPVAEGYARMARHLYADPAFVDFCKPKR